jgi:hypothetical protein
VATHLESVRRNEFLTILRYLFRTFAAESNKDFTAAEQFSSLIEQFSLWMIRQASNRHLFPEDLRSAPELKDLDPSTILDFVDRFNGDLQVAWLMGFIRWYWPMITIPRRPLQLEIENAYADFVITLKGDAPIEERTIRIHSRNEYDDQLGVLLEPQVIYQWHRCLRGAATLMLEHGLERLPGMLGETHHGKYDEAGNMKMTDESELT